MAKFLAFAGSNSKNSINKQLVTYSASLIEHHSVEIIDLNDYPLPIYSIDLEKEEGFPENVQSLLRKIEESDGIILSLAEHNGTYTAVFKNAFDWMSRIDGKSTWKGKAMLLMSTSPGGRGGVGVMQAAASRFPRHNAQIVAQYSLPSFNDNFVNGQIVDDVQRNELKRNIEVFLENFD